MTPREYLVERGLAKPGKGKFSKEAHEALAKAKAEGIVFDEPIKPAPKPKAANGPLSGKSVLRAAAAAGVEADRARVAAAPAVDSKAVRAWAADNGIAVGARGRVHPEVVAKYLAAHEGQEIPKPSKPAGTVIAGEPVRAYPEGTKFFAEKDGKRYVVNDRTACSVSGVSLGYCQPREGHQHIAVVGSNLVGLVEVRPLV